MACHPDFGPRLTAAQYAGYIVTGGQDSIINIWEIGQSREEPLFTLLGHSDNVCALHVGGDGTIISGSWDKYALLSSIPSTKLTPHFVKDRQSVD
jgi:WD40 repeat protein